MRGRSTAELVEHPTRESFARAIADPGLPCFTCDGFADALDHARGCPRAPQISSAEANAAIRAAYRRPAQLFVVPRRSEV